MSNEEIDPAEIDCPGVLAAEPSPAPRVLAARDVPLGGPRAMVVRRALPHKQIRTIGPWCFVDHFGPSAGEDPQMAVPPHPHMGLQTVSWLLTGEVEHRDSVGSHQIVRPGELSLMTAGHGIAHSEYAVVPDGGPQPMLGVQMWVALPSSALSQVPGYEHHSALPTVDLPGARARVIIGEFAGEVSPATNYAPTVAVEVVQSAGAVVQLPLEPGFEYGVVAVSGEVRINVGPSNGDPAASTDPVASTGASRSADSVGSQQIGPASVAPGSIAYLGWGTSTVAIEAFCDVTYLLIGGAPFEEHLLMWWNFVGRNHEEIALAREQWERARYEIERDVAATTGEQPRFGEVIGDPRDPLPAPEMPRIRLQARPGRRD